MIESSLQAKLQTVLGHTRVYPNRVPLVPDGNGYRLPSENELPAATYRLVSGVRHQCFQHGSGDPTTAQYLIEFFGTKPNTVFNARDAVLEAFKGPITDDDSASSVQWKANGPWIMWAEANEPMTNDDFPYTDFHDVVSWARVILEVRYSQ